MMECNFPDYAVSSVQLSLTGLDKTVLIRLFLRACAREGVGFEGYESFEPRYGGKNLEGDPGVGGFDGFDGFDSRY